MASSRISAASGVALTATLPVEVLRKSAPPSSARIGGDGRSARGRASSPVSRIAFSVAAAADVLDLAHRRGDRLGVAGGEAAARASPCRSRRRRRRAPRAVIRLHRLERLAAGREIHHGGDADAGVRRASPSAWATKRGQTQTAATEPVRGLRPAAQLGDRGGVAAVVEIGQIEADQRPAGDVRRSLAVVHGHRPRHVRGREGAGQQGADGAARALAGRGRRGSPAPPAGANSASFCRQPPQGVTGSGLSATTSTSAISVRPAATIAAIAPASAQVPCG